MVVTLFTATGCVIRERGGGEFGPHGETRGHGYYRDGRYYEYPRNQSYDGRYQSYDGRNQSYDGRYYTYPDYR